MSFSRSVGIDRGPVRSVDSVGRVTSPGSDAFFSGKCFLGHAVSAASEVLSDSLFFGFW